jgi:hypothetical protein
MSNVYDVIEVYEVDPIVKDPRFEGFGFDNDDHFDFMPEDILTKGRAWTVPRVSNVWKPEPVSGRVRPHNDYPCVNLSIPAFSERAVKALHDLLEPNGELLPLVSKVGTYFAYNVTTVADILDHEQSEIEWYDDNRDIAMDITRYAFKPRKLHGLSIFQIVEEPSRTLGSNVFVERVREHGLEGFEFKKLWPGTSSVKPKKRGAEAITAESVIIQVALSKPKPSRAEKEEMDALMDRIDEEMLAVEQQGKYLGSLKGHEYVRGELRLFFTCSSSEQLANWLKPIFESTASDREVIMTKRAGAFDDPRAHEKRVKL